MMLQKTLNLIGMIVLCGGVSNARATTGHQAEACRRLAESYRHCNATFDFDPATAEFTFPHSPRPVACADRTTLDPFARLEHPDPYGMVEIPYSVGRTDLPVQDRLANPGRLRFEPIFRATYGATQVEVERNLVPVRFLDQVVRFNRQNGAASALAAVNDELMAKIQSDHALRAYLDRWLTGRSSLREMTFSWRLVKDTDRVSSHSFGTAIDLYDNTRPEPVYWLWELAKQRASTSKTHDQPISAGRILRSIREEDSADFRPTAIIPVPPALVEAFEAHGFIWGGKWFYFDAMHFEYRPELLPDLRHARCD